MEYGNKEQPKTKMKCNEDINKRRIAKDLNETSEVEAQYSIQFHHNDVRYNIHITFYYTRCSIWIQGPAAKINNMTVAQFFAINYIERISNMIEETVPLDNITVTLKERITSLFDFCKSRSCKGNMRGEGWGQMSLF